MSRQSHAPELSPLVAKTVNAMIQSWRELDTLPCRIDGEAKLAKQFAVSRSTIRSALAYLRDLELLQTAGRQTHLVKKPLKKYLLGVSDDLHSKTEGFEAFFNQKISKSELRPGQYFSERELAIESGVNTVQVREVLAKFERFGIITKEPRHRWCVVQFDEQMIDELFDMREMIEERGIKSLASKTLTVQLRKELIDLLNEHVALDRKKQRVVQDFWDLDDRFHKYVLDSCQNRYLQDMFTSIAMLIHFQLQHDATGNYGMGVGIKQHIVVLEALLNQDKKAAVKAMLAHIKTARGVMKAAAGIPGCDI